MEQDNFAAGQRGEEETVAALQEYLDEQWTLFRNMLLPDGYGDIDAVLTGPMRKDKLGADLGWRNYLCERYDV